MNAERRTQNEELRKRCVILHSSFCILGAAFICVLLASSTQAAHPRPFHLTLEANPAAPFPFLSRFGAVTLDIYPHGVRAESIWLRGFSRNGTAALTVENPLDRTYSDMPLTGIASTVHALSGSLPELETSVPATMQVTAGNVRDIPARRFRLLFSPEAFIDVWTTSAFGDAPQFRALIDQFVRGISPGTAASMRAVPGVPLYVELNFRRFKKVAVLRMKSLTFDSNGEDDALRVSSFMFRAPFGATFK